ncbi:alpha/beta hydrolase family esterase [Limnoglobus roseus]|uniref:Putative PHB depolymerase n=1 Tax=Limnoglobus roseus TaxID=2598579 RepID=A0A5C1AHT9_9BACT|nr:hypothetical protein [Limnoglobus roseus]QEL18400.1 putative PHB depolymerase [Limnoglobus roseus]
MFSSRAALIVIALSFPAAADGSDKVELKKVTWKVGNDTREALVYNPSGTKKPVIFAWHGHGGTATFAAKKFDFHTRWPEAVVVYPQGLPTPAPLVDPDGKRAGWQKFVGDQDDRDLKLFDAMLKACVDEYGADEKRVYSAGHSNGGFFTYLLLAARPGTLAAVAPVAATITPRFQKDLKPVPVLHVAGEKDPLVKFDGQQKTIEFMRKLNGCDADGKAAGKNCTEYRAKGGPPVVAFIHPGGHEVPDGAAERIAMFFKDIDKEDQPKPLPENVVKAWKEAGATVGWMKTEMTGALTFVEKPEAGVIPAFRFEKWKDGVVPELPMPESSFGLDLAKTEVADSGLKELAKLKHMTALALCETKVTDAAVEVLRKALPKCFIFHC